ncbi:prion protein b [Paramisgurnus dabryanus]|uniref:prion protein b n=1 Tax=Paramisgurnus dabryanus TaxID=90735 RepID=UPI0031F33936
MTSGVVLWDEASSRLSFSSTEKHNLGERHSIRQTVAFSISSSVRTKMGPLYKHILLILLLMVVLHNTSEGKKGSSSKISPKKTQTSHNPLQTKTKPDSYRKPSTPAERGNSDNPNQQKDRDRDEYNLGGYPGGYPVRTGWDSVEYPVGRDYPNWNPNNKILSPHYGGMFGPGRVDTGGSPFSRSVQSMGYHPSVESKGFGKQAKLAADSGALTGMAVGYGVGQFPRPNLKFKSPKEEYYYNNYMYKRHGMGSGKEIYNPDKYEISLLNQAQTYDLYMDRCTNRTDLFREQDTLDSAGHSSIQKDDPLAGHSGMENAYTGNGWPDQTNTSSPATNNSHLMPAGTHLDENEETVSILKIGYPALIEQMKAKKCVELYIQDFLEKQIKIFPSHNNCNAHSDFLICFFSLSLLFMHLPTSCI